MSFLELAKKRYSVRSYTELKVEKEKLDLILEAGNVAPTGANAQPYRVLVVQKDKGLASIRKTANIHSAPLALIICSNSKEAWVRSYDGENLSKIDGTIVADHMMIEATELGLGSLWVCNFNPKILRTEFSIPDDLEPLHIIAIGYTDKKPLSSDRHDTTRKPLNRSVFYEIF